MKGGAEDGSSPTPKHVDGGIVAHDHLPEWWRWQLGHEAPRESLDDGGGEEEDERADDVQDDLSRAGDAISKEEHRGERRHRSKREHADPIREHLCEGYEHEGHNDEVDPAEEKACSATPRHRQASRPPSLTTFMSPLSSTRPSPHGGGSLKHWL